MHAQGDRRRPWVGAFEARWVARRALVLGLVAMAVILVLCTGRAAGVRPASPVVTHPAVVPLPPPGPHP